MNNMQKITSYLIGVPLLVFVISCNANHPTGEDLCKSDSFLEINLPRSVIVGTDIVNIEKFKLSDKQLAKSYSAELGGATIKILVTSNLQGTSIERVFQEPGEIIHNNSYKLVCISNNTMRAENFIVRIVDDGILVLETKPNVEGISNDIWVLYNDIDIDRHHKKSCPLSTDCRVPPPQTPPMTLINKTKPVYQSVLLCR